MLAVLSTTSGRMIAERRGTPIGFRLEKRAAGDAKVTFRIHLARQRSWEELEAELAAVSTPGSPRAGQHLSFQEVEKLFAARPESVAHVLAWLETYPVAIVEMRSDMVRVAAPVEVVEDMFETTMGRYVSVADAGKLGKNAPRQVAVMSRASLPSFLDEHVDHVTGLAEVFHYSHPARSGKAKVNPARPARKQTLGGEGRSAPPVPPPPPFSYNGKDTVVTPALLRDLYGIDYTPTREEAKQCIASFGQFYNPQCLDLFVRYYDNDASYGVIAESKGYNCWGIESNETCAAAQLEADLDVDYIVSVAAGIETWVWNSDKSEEETQEWLLNWAYEVTAQTGFGSSVPQVFSISYGLPEVWQCYADVLNITAYCPTFGYDSAKYIQATDAMLMQFGLRGWSVMVATGDDGAPGDSSNVPYATGYGENVVNQLAVTVTAPGDNGGQEGFTCSIPVGGMGRGFICEIVTLICTDALNEFKTGTFIQDAGCTLETNSVFGPSCSQTQPTVSSNCTLDQFPSKTWTIDGNATCTIGAYDYDNSYQPGLGVDAALQSQYPGASPFITAVGASMLTCPGQPSCTGPNTEVVCSSATGAVITSGGYFSPLHPTPTWQAQAVSAYIAANADSLPPTKAYNGAGRGAPDVAFIGHNFVIGAYDNGCGVEQGIDGTSASSPSFAGLISLINDARYAAGKASIGFLNAYLYAAPSGVFTDITEGTNACRQATTAMAYDSTCQAPQGTSWTGCSEWGYPAASGWDAASGLGAPQFGPLKDYLMSQP